MSPLFSIITCTFNAEATLERTLKSVNAQSFTDRELIIVDGASKDSTLDIVRKYDSCVTKLVSEKDRGLYDAMNKGIRTAEGKYLIFLNAGDCFHNENVLSDVASSLTGDEDVIYGQTALVDNDGNFIRMRRLSAPQNLNWKSFKSGMLVCHQAFWAKRTIALSTPYDLNYRFSSDIDWCIRIMKQSKVLFNTGLTMIDYLNEGMTTRNHKSSLSERFSIMSRHYGLVNTSLMHIWFVIRSIIKR